MPVTLSTDKGHQHEFMSERYMGNYGICNVYMLLFLQGQEGVLCLY